MLRHFTLTRQGMSKALQAGAVWVDTHRTVGHVMPFGGMKRSGTGRDGGITAIEERLETRSAWASYAEGAAANPLVPR